MSNFYFKTRKRMIAYICAITMVVAGLTVVPKTVVAGDTETDYSTLTWTQVGKTEYWVAPLEAFPMDAVELVNDEIKILPKVNAGDYKIWPAFSEPTLNDSTVGVRVDGAGIYIKKSSLNDGYNVFKATSSVEVKEFHIIISKGNPGGSGTETPGETKPNAPTNLVANIDAEKTNYTIYFNDSNTKATSYNLYIDNVLKRENINNNFILSIKDFGLKPGRTYVIGVSSVNSQGESVDKATVEIKIPVKITIDNKVKDTVTPGSAYTLPTSVNGFYDKDNKVIYKGGSKVTVNSDMNLVEIKGLSVELTNGAAIRLDDKTGIRYQAKVNVDIDAKNDATVKEEILKSGVVSAGILVTTDDILGENELTAQSNAKKVDIKNKKGEWFSNPGVFCGSIINIKEANYPRSFVARAYASIDYSDETQSNQVYSEIKVKRSIAQVAHLIQQGGYQGIGAEDKTVIDRFAGYFK